jgi:hypothetical protein
LVDQGPDTLHEKANEDSAKENLCSLRGSNVSGEPKLAAAFLNKMQKAIHSVSEQQARTLVRCGLLDQDISDRGE